MNGSDMPGSARRGWRATLADNLAAGAAGSERRGAGVGRLLLAAVMIGLGIRGLTYADFASVWQRIPIAHLPARTFFVYACALVELATGIGLLLRRALPAASGILAAYLLLWAVLLKLPAVIYVPQMEATWLGFGEIVVILAGAWLLHAAHPGGAATRHPGFAMGRKGLRGARLLFVLALPMIGLSHFVYVRQTVGFIPAWIPWPTAWARLTGGASLATSVALLLAVWPRLAATLEAMMLSVITVLVWLPGVVTAPGNDSWTPLLMSTAIASGAWVVADSYRALGWFSIGTLPDRRREIV